ncbi:hypothetical protein ACVXHB_00355 [Escherichia coli]
MITGSRKAPHPKYFVGEGKQLKLRKLSKRRVLRSFF